MKLTTALLAIAACAQIALASPMDPRVASKPSSVRHRDNHARNANDPVARTTPRVEKLVCELPDGRSMVESNHQFFVINNDGTRIAVPKQEQQQQQRGVNHNGIGTGYMVAAPVDTYGIHGVDGADYGGAADCGCSGCSIM